MSSLLRRMPAISARLLQGLLVVGVAATVAFVCLELAPGDRATALGENVPLAVRERVRAMQGLNDPIAVQYWRWMRAVASGDFGWSVAQQRPALPVLMEASRNTLMLVGPAFALSLCLGMLLGAWQAVHAGARRDRWSSLLTLAVYSVPEFWLAFLLIMFGHRWLGLPVGGMVSDLHMYMGPLDRLQDRIAHLVLPVMTVALVGVGIFARYQRSSLYDVLQLPFVRTAHAAGLPARRVYWHAWRAALLPVLTVAGLVLPAFVAGVVVIEQVFLWPGLGHTMLMAIAARDADVVTGCVIIGSSITVLGAMGTDVLRRMVDPRLGDASTTSQPPLVQR
jgi:peptide/nickel transport system permease protein